MGRAAPPMAEAQPASMLLGCGRRRRPPSAGGREEALRFQGLHEPHAQRRGQHLHVRLARHRIVVAGYRADLDSLAGEAAPIRMARTHRGRRVDRRRDDGLRTLAGWLRSLPRWAEHGSLRGVGRRPGVHQRLDHPRAVSGHARRRSLGLLRRGERIHRRRLAERGGELHREASPGHDCRPDLRVHATRRRAPSARRRTRTPTFRTTLSTLSARTSAPATTPARCSRSPWRATRKGRARRRRLRERVAAAVRACRAKRGPHPPGRTRAGAVAPCWEAAARPGAIWGSPRRGSRRGGANQARGTRGEERRPVAAYFGVAFISVPPL